MRILFYPTIALSTAAAIATAQAPQSTVDIRVSAAFGNGAITAQVTRNDPGGVALAPAAKVRVSVGLKGEKPFFSTDIALKPGGSQSVSAPFSGSTSNVTFTVSAYPLDLKELASADNVRDVSPGVLAVMPMRVPVMKAGARIPVTGAPPTPAPARTTPPTATITTPQIVLVGGASGAAPIGTAGASITTPSIVLIGGTQGPTPVAPAGMTITTSPITLIGKQE